MSAPDRIWLSEPDECNYHEVWFDSDYGGTEYIRTDLVAITTQPDPRDEVIAEAEARGMRRAADIAKLVAGGACDTPDEIRGAAMVEYAILAAIPKGGDA